MLVVEVQDMCSIKFDVHREALGVTGADQKAVVAMRQFHRLKWCKNASFELRFLSDARQGLSLLKHKI